MLHNLNGLDEIRMDPMHHTQIVQKQGTKWHDHFIKTKEFNVGDWDLLYDSKYKYYKEIYNPNGWDPIKSNRYSSMEQSNCKPQMKLDFQCWLIDIN